MKYKRWIEGEGLKRVLEWVKHGLTDEQVAKNMGIDRSTFHSWMKKKPEFGEAVREAKIQPNIEIENAMFNLACGKTFVEETKTIIDAKDGSIIRIEKTRKQVPPSAVLLIFLAKNRMRDRYRLYAATPNDNKESEEKTDVQIYLPDNGRDNIAS